MNAKTLFRSLVLVALGATVVVSAPLAANAGAAKPEVVVPRVGVPHVGVPNVPAPGGIAGCWSAQQRIYGPYSFSFCSNGSYGSYKVRGGGLFCDGSVTVRPGWGDTVTVRLSRSPCNGWTDWSADYLVCRSAGQWTGGWNGAYPGVAYKGPANPEVVVPHAPNPRVATPRVPVAGWRLDCTYVPVAPGYRPIGLAMTRS